MLDCIAQRHAVKLFRWKIFRRVRSMGHTAYKELGSDSCKSKKDFQRRKISNHPQGQADPEMAESRDVMGCTMDFEDHTNKGHAWAVNSPWMALMLDYIAHTMPQDLVIEERCAGIHQRQRFS